MFSRIFIEKHLKHHPRAVSIKEHFPSSPIKYIKNIDTVFGRVKKPYLQKRESLQLFLGEKKGQLVKKAPTAYGLSGDPHYYFVHAYNCIYECQYCYLQGYFHSPDIVHFINHEDIGREIISLAQKASPQKTPWFHGGEFSDNLALEAFFHELPYYFDLFKQLPKAKLELRTKSAYIRPLQLLTPQKNIIVSYSLSPKKRILKTDIKTPPLATRLSAMKALHKLGHPLAVHLDPIIFETHFKSAYQELLEALETSVGLKKIEYFSLGVVRLTSSAYREVKRNYPENDFLASPLIKSYKDKIRYPQSLRSWILGTVKRFLLERGVSEKKIYFCME